MTKRTSDKRASWRGASGSRSRVKDASSRGKHARSAPPPQTKRKDSGGNSLTGAASRALGWSFASTLLTRVTTLGTGIVLARLLGPHAFGTYAVALVALLAMQTFNELGVSLAIVRWEDDPREITPTVTTISVFVSCLAYIACFFGAPAFAATMGDPSAAGVVRFLALCILIDGFCNTPSGVLERAFQQGRKMFAIQVGGWLGTGVTLFLAWSGYGAMSLAIGQVAGSMLCMLILVGFVPSSLRFGFNLRKANALLRFGLPLAGSNLISFAIFSIDQLIVGHMLGTVSLGYFVLALNMASWPLNMLSRPIRSVLPATLSRLQHDRAIMRDTFLTTLALLGAVALPICLFVSGSARPLIGFVYGTRWLPAALPLEWLALAASLRILFEPTYDYLVVLGLSRAVLVVQLIWMLFLAPALIVGIKVSGIYGAGAAEATVAAIAVLPCYLRCLRSAGVGLRSLSKRLIFPILGACAVWIVATKIAKEVGSDFVALVLSGIATLVVVAVLMYRLRSAVALLRASHAESTRPDVNSTEDTIKVTSERGPESFDNELTAELAANWGVANVSPPARGPWRNSNIPLQQALLASRAPLREITEPIPVYRDIPDFFSGRVLDTTSPIYSMTVKSRQWDPYADRGKPLPPAAGPRGGRADPGRQGPLPPAAGPRGGRADPGRQGPLPPAAGPRGGRADPGRRGRCRRRLVLGAAERILAGRGRCRRRLVLGAAERILAGRGRCRRRLVLGAAERILACRGRCRRRLVLGAAERILAGRGRCRRRLVLGAAERILAGRGRCRRRLVLGAAERILAGRGRCRRRLVLGAAERILAGRGRCRRRLVLGAAERILAGRGRCRRRLVLGAAERTQQSSDVFREMSVPVLSRPWSCRVAAGMLWCVGPRGRAGSLCL